MLAAIESRPSQLLGSSELLTGSVSKLSLRMDLTEPEGLLTMSTIVSVTGVRSFPWWQLMSAIFYLTMAQVSKGLKLHVMAAYQVNKGGRARSGLI